VVEEKGGNNGIKGIVLQVQVFSGHDPEKARGNGPFSMGFGNHRGRSVDTQTEASLGRI
jgi:hypothetical protein